MILLGLAGYKIITTDSSLRASLVIQRALIKQLLNILCLWLGARNGCIASLVKVLGIVLSPGNVAVENVLNSRGHRHNFMN